MKITKISLVAALIAGVLLAGSSAARAQDGKKENKDAPKREGRPGGPDAGKRGEMLKERLDKMSEELKLSAEQKTKVEAAMKEQGETMRGLRDAAPEERREKMKSAREAMDKKLKDILTADQFEKFQKLRPAGGPEGKKGPGGKKGDGEKKA